MQTVQVVRPYAMRIIELYWYNDTWHVLQCFRYCIFFRDIDGIKPDLILLNNDTILGRCTQSGTGNLHGRAFD
jgi:hypothetical protein